MLSLVSTANKTYRVHAFAELSGVTVKTLHHYDRLGLLKPARTAAGYRVYTQAHLARLEQIIALKTLAMPLKEIRSILERDPLPLRATFLQQRSVLEEQRRALDLAIGALEQAEQAIERDPGPCASTTSRRCGARTAVAGRGSAYGTDESLDRS